ncbi:hypothetical protein SDRG_13561 [Saprolegnia diclina VS20]|uniref:LD-carboxypeptidase n=1 Tax=Saprolegnia diclina (strain VS20) TaxID=1156394 RepID=T0Q294_SAPDV|nr:hypothetical protein SDRG_13561 [Saprolegnia diclina VS20]EQC28686.1 hypothetical protein SDRG_13561 [Saprolegnia diclina VS20]|eukprot:XP_008617878.1 hypothetical protein SDRG_13561 [Saprolegnia diclina VS20]
MPLVVPRRLQRGSVVRVVAPSQHAAILSQATITSANAALAALGVTLTFGDHIFASDPCQRHSSSIADRVADLHAAFLDETVDGILTVIGGYNANQLLSALDYDLIRSHPKVFCGYSDITALINAFLAKAHLVTFSGPHYSTFGMSHGLEFTIQEFVRVLMSTAPGIEVATAPSPMWRNDLWFLDPTPKFEFENTAGFEVVRSGVGRGTILGGNLNVLGLLRGTPYFPLQFPDVVLFLECTGENDVATFDQLVQALLHMPGFAATLRGIVVGRFELNSKMGAKEVEAIFRIKNELPSTLPIVYGVDFGHTTPHTLIPIGGSCTLDTRGDAPYLGIAW